jgi:hypothetical protein
MRCMYDKEYFGAHEVRYNILQKVQKINLSLKSVALKTTRKCIFSLQSEAQNSFAILRGHNTNKTNKVRADNSVKSRFVNLLTVGTD